MADIILDSSASGEIVPDPFAGSGATLIAAANMQEFPASPLETVDDR
ncbi:MAG: DNA methyltransferase [Acetobacteraceae bacterium]